MYNVQFVKCGTAALSDWRLHTTGTLKFKGQVYRNISHSTLLCSYKVTTRTATNMQHLKHSCAAWQFSSFLNPRSFCLGRCHLNTTIRQSFETHCWLTAKFSIVLINPIMSVWTEWECELCVSVCWYLVRQITSGDTMWTVDTSHTLHRII